MGCDLRFFCLFTICVVSIHAPAWGATRASKGISKLPSVSIHAPAWGATLCGMLRPTPSSFNPRTRMGCDLLSLCLYMTREAVSIHAPAWGATVFVLNALIIIMFQSTHPHGVRLGMLMSRMYFHRFQSTHPHGVRLSRFSGETQRTSFNPRTRMGCDRILSNELNIIVQIYRICE